LIGSWAVALMGRDNLSFRCEAAGADRHAERVEDDLFDQLDNLLRQPLIGE
jgi:hypothetical protein